MKKNSAKWGITLLSTVIILAACHSESVETGNTEALESLQPQKLHITMDEAEQNLNKIIMEMKLNNTRGAQNRDFTVTSRYSTDMGKTRADGDSVPAVYVFNFGNKEGFAIMSSDIREPDLYELSFSGELKIDSVIDDPFDRIFVSALKLRSDSLGGFPIDDDDDLGDPINFFVVYTPWETTNKVYEDGTTELCKVKWDQGSPYNGMLDTYNGENIPTGCAATAVGQLMSVYKYPDIYPPFVLDWDNIVSYQTMTNNTPFWPLYEVQSLMKYLGMYYNLDLDYDAANNQNTLHNINNITRTLSNFGYSNPGTIANYQTSTIVAELNSGYPVLISGKDDPSIGGHIWLGHGLQTKSRKKIIYDGTTLQPVRIINQAKYYILCNMGYGGSSDKLYLSGIFDTRIPFEIEIGSNVGNYQYDLKMITGIRE